MPLQANRGGATGPRAPAKLKTERECEIVDWHRCSRGYPCSLHGSRDGGLPCPMVEKRTAPLIQLAIRGVAPMLGTPHVNSRGRAVCRAGTNGAKHCVFRKWA